MRFMMDVLLVTKDVAILCKYASLHQVRDVILLEIPSPYLEFSQNDTLPPPPPPPPSLPFPTPPVTNAS